MINNRCPKCNGISAFITGSSGYSALSDLYKLECIKCRYTWMQAVDTQKDDKDGGKETKENNIH